MSGKKNSKGYYLTHDVRAYDGNIWKGWRKVKKGGRVQFDGNIYQDDRLLFRVDDYVFVVFEGKYTFSNGPVSIAGHAGCDAHKILVESDYDKQHNNKI